MKNSWWVSLAELNTEQKTVITIPADGNHLIVGPPGSGKTNLLLLRANYLYLSGMKNLIVVVFTRTLRDFMSLGGAQYQFPPEKLVTLYAFERTLLADYGKSIDQGLPFDEQRIATIKECLAIVESQNLRSMYDAILLDEAQDFSSDEMKLFTLLSQRVFVVADSRQKIYDWKDGLDGLPAAGFNEIRLQYHYRNGLSICRLADRIAKQDASFEALAPTSQYNELANPSEVTVEPCNDFPAQISRLIARLQSQLKVFPDELLGVVSPRNDEVAAIWAAIAASDLAPVSVFRSSQEQVAFADDVRICVASVHATKGLEFRALHVLAAENFSKFKYQRNMAFMATTRAKTMLTFYHTAGLPGYLEGALASLSPPTALPTPDAAFGKKT